MTMKGGTPAINGCTLERPAVSGLDTFRYSCHHLVERSRWHDVVQHIDLIHSLTSFPVDGCSGDRRPECWNRCD